MSKVPDLLPSKLGILRRAPDLAMFPFLVFQLPLIGEALVKTCPTAYDQTGRLVVKLSKYSVHELYEKHRQPPPSQGNARSSTDRVVTPSKPAASGATVAPSATPGKPVQSPPVVMPAGAAGPSASTELNA